MTFGQGGAPNGRREMQRAALAVVLIVAFVLAAYVAAPLWVGLMLGTVLAFTTQPLYTRLSIRLHGRARLAALLVTLGSGLASLAILAAAVYVVTDELVFVVKWIQAHATGRSPTDVLGPRMTSLLQHVGASPDAVVERLHRQVDAAATSVAHAAGTVAQAVTNALLGLLLALITMYYVLREWPSVTHRLETILPLDPSYTRALMVELREVGRGALLGTVATALVQGGLAGFGYMIFGVPQAVTWATLTAIASFVPVVGTMMVWVPLGVYLIFEGRLVAGFLVLAWGVVVVTTLSDYVIRPRIVGKTGRGHPLLMLVALLGGLESMGLGGLIVGPIVMSFFLAVLRLYEKDTESAGGL